MHRRGVFNLPLAFAGALVLSAQQPVSIPFEAVVGDADLACGKSYPNAGTTKATITPRDFRFYVHNIRLVDHDGKEVPFERKQDEKWQLDNLALLGLESAYGSCANGTPKTNSMVTGTFLTAQAALPTRPKPQSPQSVLSPIGWKSAFPASIPQET